MLNIDVPETVPVGSIEAVIAERIRQVEQFGHTPEDDLKLELGVLPKEARQYLSSALDELHFRRAGWRDRYRFRLKKAGAMILAALDQCEEQKEVTDSV